MATNPEIENPEYQTPTQNNPQPAAQPFQENPLNQNHLAYPLISKPCSSTLLTKSSLFHLTDTNYLVWRQQVVAGVKGYGLEGFLFGTIPKIC